MSVYYYVLELDDNGNCYAEEICWEDTIMGRIGLHVENMIIADARSSHKLIEVKI